MTAETSVFEIERVIGHGGMGVVHAAVDRRNGRRVALKRIHPRLLQRPIVLERFQREARAQSRIRSPFVVGVIDVGHDAEGPYLAMELLEGEALAERLERDERLSVEETLRIGDELLAGAEAAHRAGVIHRDLTIGNVFLARTPHGEQVKILDFGISKLEGQGGSLTGTGEVFGTLEHLAPERFEKVPATNRSDLWSIAVVIYRCLGGTTPFDGPNDFQLIARILEDPPAPLPASVDDRVREAFAPFLARAFEKKPANRFASADEMRGALEQVRAVLTGTRPLALVAPPRSPSPPLTPKRRSPLAFVVALVACAAAGAWAGTPSRPNAPPPSRAAFAVDTDPNAMVTLDGLMVIDRARVPFPSDKGHVLRVSAPGHVAREVGVPARPGTRLRVRLAKDEAPPPPAATASAATPAEAASVPIEVATQEPATHAAKPVARPHPHPAPPASSGRGLKPITRPPY